MARLTKEGAEDYEMPSKEQAIQRTLDEREALYMDLNGIKPTMANYWQLPETQRQAVKQQIGKR